MGTVIVCTNILITVLLQFIEHQIILMSYNLQYSLGNWRTSSLSNCTNFVFDSFKTTKLFTILFKMVARWLLDCSEMYVILPNLKKIIVHTQEYGKM